MEPADAKTKQEAELSPNEYQGQKEVTQEEEVFYPVQLPQKKVDGQGGREATEKEIKIEQELQQLLGNISEETLQLREFLNEENRLKNELCASIGQILSRLNISFNIPPRNINFGREVKAAILDKKGKLMLVSHTGGVRSAFLAEYPPEIVMVVLWTVMPKLAEVVARYKRKVNRRIGFFRKLKMELKTIAKIVAGGKGENQRSTMKEGKG